MVGPLHVVLEFPATAAEHVRGNPSDPVQRITQENIAVDAVRRLPFFDVAVGPDTEIAAEEVIHPEASASLVLFARDAPCLQWHPMFRAIVSAPTVLGRVSAKQIDAQLVRGEFIGGISFVTKPVLPLGRSDRGCSQSDSCHTY